MNRKKATHTQEKHAAERRSKKRMHKYDHSSGKSRILFLPLLALVLTLIVEGLNQGSLPQLIDYVLHRPLYFVYNFLIILTSLTFSELFKRRKAVLSVISLVWMGLGIAEFIIIQERTSPFVSLDLFMIKDFISLTSMYFTWVQIILTFAAAFLVILAVIWLFHRLPRRKRVNYAVALSVFCGMLALTVCASTVGISTGIFPRYYENLVEAYDRYGFTSCFVFTFGVQGVSKPTDDISVMEIVDEINDGSTNEHHVFDQSDNLEEPNIIYVQLESFFDPSTIIDAEYSADPIPNFNRLVREFPSGMLYMPSVGGGTANSEFEVLSGMNVDFFGAGEYPYNTILLEKTTETIAYNLKALNYATTAMHNYTATFYGRDDVYGHLGFDHFVSMEYMPYLTYTDIGWARDIVLADEILKTLDATEARDFIMAITVESHGKYAENFVPKEGDVEILSLPEQFDQGAFASYLRLIADADVFVGELISMLEDYDEPVICVFYGDHLPAIDLTADVLTTNTLYATPYVIWNNYDAEFDAPNMQAYRLSAHLFKQLGMTGGIITKLHQSVPTDEVGEDYLLKLEMLQYDLLYGEQEGYAGENPYVAIDLQMGCLPITVRNASQLYGRLLVNGDNFTEYSAIVADGTVYPTAFINTKQLIAIVPRTTHVEELYIAQLTPDGTELSRTSTYTLADD